MDVQKRKVGIIGAGHVGSHAGYALLSQGLAEEIVYIDIDVKKAEAQALDLFDATVYLPRRAIVRAGNYADIADAQLLIVAAGPLPSIDKGQTRMDTLRETIDVMKDIILHLGPSGFMGILLSISNPADVVAHYLQHKLGYPPHKVLSTSTTLDSARLRRALAEATGIDQKSIFAYVLGEHGESQMVPWSVASVAGKPLAEWAAEHEGTIGKLDLKAIAQAGRRGGWQVLAGKGSTEFAIGASIAEVARAILGDENRILPVATLLEGQYGQGGVYASVPALLNRNGVAKVLQLRLTKQELALFAASCKTMDENYRLALTL